MDTLEIEQLEGKVWIMASFLKGAIARAKKGRVTER